MKITFIQQLVFVFRFVSDSIMTKDSVRDVVVACFYPWSPVIFYYHYLLLHKPLRPTQGHPDPDQ